MVEIREVAGKEVLGGRFGEREAARARGWQRKQVTLKEE